MKISLAVACLLGFASTQDVLIVDQPKDLPTCISDIEALIPGVEGLIADFKAGNYDKALTDGLALLPDAEKAATDCLSSAKKEKLMKIVNVLQKVSHVEDLPTCISDIEAMIPDVEKVIADFKAGNYEQALTDGMALLPEAEKAYSDCLSSKPFKKQVGDLQKCIDDVEGLIPGVEKVIADLKAGNQNKAILDLTLLLPKAEAAYAECTGSGKKGHKVFMKIKMALKNGKPEDLPTCIADLEAAIPDVEKIIADFKAGNYDQALTDALALVPEVEKAYTDCLSSKKKEFKNYKDLPTCIADIEAAIPDVEKIIADFKAGNYDQALTDALALVPTVEKAYTDCLSSAKPHVMRRVHKLKKFLSKINVRDLPTCIADLEAAIPDVEKIIADFKAGNYDQALTDALALVPEVEKAYSDCLSSAKDIKGRFKTILKDDPKREYFEKLGAEFASGFFAGTKVDHFDTIDLYNCLHREPTAVGYFYKADEEMKYALIKHDAREIIKALDELVGFLAEMVMEDYPHSRTQVCKEFQDKEAQWGDLKMVLTDLKNPDLTLQEHDHHFTFNHQDITSSLVNIVDDYVKQNWSRLGYQYGSTLLDAAAHQKAGLTLE